MLTGQRHVKHYRVRRSAGITRNEEEVVLDGDSEHIKFKNVRKVLVLPEREKERTKPKTKTRWREIVNDALYFQMF